MKKSLCLSIALILSPAVYAADTEISLLSGYRTGGDFESASTGANVGLEDSSSYTIILGKDYGPEHVMEFTYSHQNSNLVNKNTIPNTQLLNMDVDYFYLGGSQIWANKKSESFFGAGLGAVHLSPNNATVSSTTKFSMNLNGGIVFKLTETIGLRLSVIGYFSSVGSSSTICNNNTCKVVGSGFMRQYEANAGLRFRF